MLDLNSRSVFDTERSAQMSRKTYLFELVDVSGRPFKKVSRRCTNLSAQNCAARLLNKTPNAAAAYGYEIDGVAVFSAYRS